MGKSVIELLERRIAMTARVFSRVAIALRRRFKTKISYLLLDECGLDTCFDIGSSIYGAENIRIGNSCTVNSRVILQSCDGAKILLGDNVTLSYGAMLLTGGLNLSSKGTSSRHAVANITIGDNVWIGASAIVLPGISVGDNSVLAAGSIATQNIPSNQIWAGSPARVIKTISSDNKANEK